MSSNIALYVHFPFCRRKCTYCSFVSYEHRETDIPSYVNAVKRELALHAAGQQVHSIYFGGGTPSLLSHQQVKDILSTIRSLCIVEKTAEVTMEVNPGTIDERYLAAIRLLGINRLSLGLQSLDDSDLMLLGRIHTATQAKIAMCMARNAGFDNLNLDIIYAIPCQTLSGWHDMLTEIIEFNPEHLSLYPLSLDDNVPMQLAIDNGEIPPLDPDQSADQYELAEDLLESYGYQHYEISNWARKGRKCQHNMVYWKNMPYLGIGCAAHSYLNSHRSANTTDIDKYLNAFHTSRKPPIREMNEKINPELQLSETIIMGLRLDEGVKLADIQERFGIDLLKQYGKQVEELTGLCLLKRAGGYIRLTRRGRLLGNDVFRQFLPL